MITFALPVLLAGLIGASSPSAPASPALRCAAVNGVLAAMLESGAPDDEDQAQALQFRHRADDWVKRADRSDADADARLDAEMRALAAAVAGSGGPDAAQRLLEARLAECPLPASAGHDRGDEGGPVAEANAA